MSDLAKRLRRVGEERQRTTAHDDPTHYLHVVAKISNADGLLMLEAADEITRLTARVAKLEGALQAWDDAVKIDVVMEGPRYMGVDYRRGFIAWEKTLAALKPATTKDTADE
jgi:hypothetical protein